MKKKQWPLGKPAIMDDDDDLADLFAIELALQNPVGGTVSALALEQLNARARERDARMFPSVFNPISGALCFCQKHCVGEYCHCWCHVGESP
jgi:hypothetical protein